MKKNTEILGTNRANAVKRQLLQGTNMFEFVNPHIQRLGLETIKYSHLLHERKWICTCESLVFQKYKRNIKLYL